MASRLQWLLHHDLRDGDEVEIVIDEELIIRPERKQRKSGNGKKLEQRNIPERRDMRRVSLYVRVTV